ncbi:hypothetical protein ACIOHE_26480 [Streptomyces sp. NPDC087851]|uniref:hypothetical protein n=1 Tax=Streptomyces sp. NPDC087851 TaxID=3365810 RepID=UPI003818740F
MSDTMYGVPDPVISERRADGGKTISHHAFAADMRSVVALHHPVHVWTGQDRTGRPLAVAWVAGRRAGRLLGAYEFTPAGA